MEHFETVEGGVTSPQGFRASGVQAGIKRRSRDLALLLADNEATVAGTFTTNRVQAAPVGWCRTVVAGGCARLVVVNSGNANACTGPQGVADTARMAAVAGEALGLAPEQVLVCSTGTIGIPLPMQSVESGILKAVRELDPEGGAAAATAILTTDTCPKERALALTVDGKRVTVGGMTKGSGMIDPSMATMLAFLTTDAAVTPGALQTCLSAAVDRSFNAITVDGDQSTNDTALMLANGAAGNAPLQPGHPDWERFCDAVLTVARDLAIMIVKDGEGATRFVEVRVEGAHSDADARLAARAVAGSLLVKTAWTGGDPNWGRTVAALGYSGADFDPDQVRVWFDDLLAVEGGMQSPDISLSDLAAVIARPDFVVRADLGAGDGSFSVYTCDCSQEYVRINSEYMT